MSRAKILIVEDEGIEALDLQHRLISLGYTVLDAVSTGEEAVGIAEETCPDLVLMDIMLSGEIDGVTAAEQIQNRFDIPIIYLTARIETKGQDFRPTNLDDIVKNAAGDLEVAIQKAGARLEIGPLPIVHGDPCQLRQLFQNLIANSVKYHRSEVRTIINIYGEEIGGATRIFVEDNGIGFDEQYLDKIFQPFQRLHGKTEYSGTGIGLAICRKIVERHGGTITGKSTPSEGATFVVTLPAKKGAA